MIYSLGHVMYVQQIKGQFTLLLISVHLCSVLLPDKINTYMYCMCTFLDVVLYRVLNFTYIPFVYLQAIN